MAAGSLLVTGAGLRRLDPTVPDDDADALIIRGDRISWIGRSEAAPPTEQRLDVDGWLSPAFVDAHVHATATGLAAESVSLAGCASLPEALTRLRDYGATSSLDPVLGGRWDETAWTEQRPPSADELAQALPGRTVLLERVDSHSCIVDAATLARLDASAAVATIDPGDVVRNRDGRPTGWLKESAAAAARMRVHDQLPKERLDRARRAACDLALSRGIASFHEMGHPAFFGLDDALAWATGTWGVDVLVWWAEPDIAACPRGLRLGGDLFLDGSIGSATAAVSGGYQDIGGAGTLFLSDEVVAGFFTEASCAGVGAAVHVIGDRAIEQGLRGLEHAAQAVGKRQVRACRHRFEHVELPRPDHARRLADLGVVASMQPGFDATWGGSDGLYARRFGAQAALASNPFAVFFQAGVPLAFGSDSTVTQMNPWSAVLAAERHLGGLSLERSVAWSSHTLGGRYAAGQDKVGPLRVDFRADVVVWDADPFRVKDLTAIGCLATVVKGVLQHRGDGEKSAETL